MWFPYSLPTNWKAECGREHVNDSFADQSQREFLIAFQLRNPVVQEWSAELHLSEPHWLAQQDGDANLISIGYYPNEQERLSEIICKVQDRSAQSAVRRSYDAVLKSLSYWAADYGRGFAIGGMRIADLEHDARWRILPHWPSAQRFAIPRFDEVPESFWPVADLYREARTSSSDRYRFLCCHTILSKWAHDEEPFSTKEAETASRCVTQELMVLSGMLRFRRELEGTRLSVLPHRLEDWREAALRFVLEGGTGSRAGQFDSTLEWISVANLVDLAAHLVLNDLIQSFQGQRARAADRVSGPAGADAEVPKVPGGIATVSGMG